MIDDNESASGEAFVRPTPDYDKDSNVQARKRAGKRAANSKAGKNIEEGVTEPEAVAEETQADGGIVAEAEQELEAVQSETSEGEAEPEAPGEVEPESESEVEPESTEEPEGDTAIEQFAEEEASEPEHQDSGAIEQFAKEEAAEPQHQTPMEPVGDYQAPEGESHDELIDKYHEALAFGDIEQAKVLYKQLQDHRYAENVHRAKSDAQAQAEAQAYVDATTELVAAHPELGEDGLPANKVLALSDVYRQEGLSAAEAIRKAVADLYPAAPAVEEPAALPEEPVEPATASEPEEAAVAEAGEPAPETESLLPDMTERNLQKRNIPAMPSASARNEPAPEPPKPTRTSAIQAMKEKRGQA